MSRNVAGELPYFDRSVTAARDDHSVVAAALDGEDSCSVLGKGFLDM